jgi:hypothetical protein
MRWDALRSYDLTPVRGIAQRDAISRAKEDRSWSGMWRYRTVLPSIDPVTLGEGWTPMLPSRRYENVFLKEEGANPTGTFTARGLALAITMARHYGIKKVAVSLGGQCGRCSCCLCCCGGNGSAHLHAEGRAAGEPGRMHRIWRTHDPSGWSYLRLRPHGRREKEKEPRRIMLHIERVGPRVHLGEVVAAGLPASENRIKVGDPFSIGSLWSHKFNRRI